MKKSVLLLTLALAAALPASADSLFTKEVANEGPPSPTRTRVRRGRHHIVWCVRTSATTESNTNTKKESEIVAEAPVGSNTFLVAKKPDGLGLLKKERLPNWDIEVENEHKGRGDTSRSNRLTTTISCTVTKVFENGNLEIMGNKRVTVNSEDSTVLLTGTVRARDVSPENTVPSDRVANAIVELKGKGPLWNNQRRGILTKLLDWFSPF